MLLSIEVKSCISKISTPENLRTYDYKVNVSLKHKKHQYINKKHTIATVLYMEHYI